MSARSTRREFLRTVPVAGLSFVSFGTILAPIRALAADPPLPSFPQHDPDVVRSVVGFSHGKLDDLRPLVEARPALANAALDWGFGDWETAIGAASHVGRPDIAEFLMSHGARPDLFTFAMLGNAAALRAMIEARPGTQRLRGPHGITLLQHARNGGDPAKAAVAYLESLGDADPKYRDDALTDAEKASLLGEYSFGSNPQDVLVVKEGMGGVTLSRKDGVPRRLMHQGGFEFHPTGAPSVHVRFEPGEKVAARIRITDATIDVTAERMVG